MEMPIIDLTSDNIGTSPCSFGTAGIYRGCPLPATTQTGDGDLVCMQHALYQAQVDIAAASREHTKALDEWRNEVQEQIVDLVNAAEAIDDRLHVIAWYSTPLLLRIWSLIRQKLNSNWLKSA